MEYTFEQPPQEFHSSQKEASDLQLGSKRSIHDRSQNQSEVEQAETKIRNNTKENDTQTPVIADLAILPSSEVLDSIGNETLGIGQFLNSIRKPHFKLQLREKLLIQSTIQKKHKKIKSQNKNQDILQYTNARVLNHLQKCYSQKKLTQLEKDLINLLSQRKINKQLFKQLCGLQKIIYQQEGKNSSLNFDNSSAPQFKITKETDTLRTIIKSYLQSSSFLQSIINGEMKFSNILKTIKKLCVLQKFPIEPWKITKFNEL